jgi:hypothetical protein
MVKKLPKYEAIVVRDDTNLLLSTWHNLACMKRLFCASGFPLVGTLSTRKRSNE